MFPLRRGIVDAVGRSCRAGRFGSFLSDLRVDKSGATALLTGLAATVLIGFGGLAVDVGYWQVTQHKMQGAADEAAWSAAIAYNAGENTMSQAQGITANYGLINNRANTSVTVNQPPSQGNYTSNSSAIEVIIKQPANLWLTNLFFSAAPNITARAVALASSPIACVIALNSTINNALQVAGGTDLDLPCNIYVNSTNSQATQIAGGATLEGTNIYLSGGYQNGGTFSATNTFKANTGSPVVADPFVSLTPPTVGACGSNPTSPSGGGSPGQYQSPNGQTTTIYPGVYCGNFQAQGTLNMQPGVYIINSGSFQVNGTVNATGGVTVYLTSTSNQYQGFQINGGGAAINLTAPTTGSTAGIAIWVDKNAPSNIQVQFNGGSSSVVFGAIYAPNSEIQFNGGSDATQGCVQLIGGTIQLNGGTDFAENCAGVSSASPKLVE
jgi:Putative Flp pilus-assembly TadE/G-like